MWTECHVMKNGNKQLPKAVNSKSRKSEKNTSKSQEQPQVNSTMCSVCERTILDGEPGQESIYCEGECLGWIHRRCAALSKRAFQLATESEDPFLCHYCASHKQGSEIKILRVPSMS